MRQVPSTSLWIGDRGDLRDPSVPRKAGIVAVVDLALEEDPVRLDRERVVLRVPLTDGGGNSPEAISLAIGVVESLIRQGLPTLVVCSAGMSRSPAITAMALRNATGQNIEFVLGTLRAIGPLDISPALWASVLRVSRDTGNRRLDGRLNSSSTDGRMVDE